MDFDGPPPVEDAEADFLEREKNVMADLDGDDFGFTQPDQPNAETNDNFSENPFGAPLPTDNMEKLSLDEVVADNDFEQLDAPPACDPTSELAAQFPEDPLADNAEQNLDAVAAANDDLNFGQSNVDEFAVPTPDQEEAEEPSGYNAIKIADVQHAEPEKIKRWRAEQKERIEKKDEECVKKSIEWKETAKKELADWYKHNEEQVTKTKANNVIAEEDFIKERDDSAPGHEWQRICRLCDFSGSQSSKSTKSVKDVSRMRSILLQLKQTPLVRT